MTGWCAQGEGALNTHPQTERKRHRGTHNKGDMSQSVSESISQSVSQSASQALSVVHPLALVLHKRNNTQDIDLTNLKA